MIRNNFQDKISYKFSDENLLSQALTHSSYTKEKALPRTMCNERLEFLGDAFLDAIVGEELYKKLFNEKEGVLTKIRSLIVCEEGLVQVGNSIDIGKYIKMGRGEELSGGRKRASIIADAVEGLIGAIYLDGTYVQARAFVLENFEKRIKDAIDGNLDKDYKSELQEKVQSTGVSKIEYVLEKEEGPAHNKSFFVKVKINGQLCGKGEGKSKKEAEQRAAKEAILGGNENAF